jgi:heme/copper-type cytochrome/quinol oxidase subunit 4
MWFWIGIIVGAALTALVVWLRNRNIKLAWYEYLLGVLAIAFGAAAVQHYFGSMAEYEYKSAWMGALVFGVICIVLAAVDWQLVIRHKKTA